MKSEDSIRKFVVNSPIEKVTHPLLKDVRLCVKREDKIHPTISGNKWRKLKYNLLNSRGLTIVTFGGAFSNHIYATAAACNEFGLASVGIIRGEYDEGNPILQFAKSCGMELKFVDRTSYRDKAESPIVQKILKEIPDRIVIPEGGSNDLALQGIHELSEEINQTDFDVIMVSAGTGCTATGILQKLDSSKQLWVFSSLKSDYLKDEILNQVDESKHSQLKFINDYHFGGYGKSPSELIDFINDFTIETSIPVDPIYNGKLVSGFCEMAKDGSLNQSKSYLWIHTGGLQGIAAYNYMANKKSKPRILD